MQGHDAEPAVGQEKFACFGKARGGKFYFAHGLILHEAGTDDPGADGQGERRGAELAVEDEEEVAEGGGKQIAVVVGKEGMMATGLPSGGLRRAVQPVVRRFPSGREWGDRFGVQTRGLLVRPAGGIVRFEKGEEARCGNGRGGSSVAGREVEAEDAGGVERQGRQLDFGKGCAEEVRTACGKQGEMLGQQERFTRAKADGFKDGHAVAHAAVGEGKVRTRLP